MVSVETVYGNSNEKWATLPEEQCRSFWAYPLIPVSYCNKSTWTCIWWSI